MIVERDDDRAAGNPLGHAVLREALQFQVEPVEAPGAEALAGFALEANLDAPMVRHAFPPVELGDHAGGRGPDRAVAVADAEDQVSVHADVDGIARRLDDLL